jgi:radical SAM protein with 4Fe4S-binding SPASM domain
MSGKQKTMNRQKKKGPPVIGWEITRQCNLTCPHCFSAAAKRPHDEMGTQECLSVVDSMAQIGVDLIGWTGGEPLLRDDLEEIITYAGQKGIKSSVTTNAVLLDEKRIVGLKDAGNRAIQISLDGSTPAINGRMRGTTDKEYHKIIEAIRICKKHHVRLTLATLLGEENLDDAAEMVNLAKCEGVETIRFCGFTPVGRGKRADVRDRLSFNKRMIDLFHFVEDAQLDASIMVTFDHSFGPIPPIYQFHECMAGREIFYLKGNGDLYPCTSLLQKQFCVGNIRLRPLEELWNDPADCDNFINCHGACRGATFAHTGDINASFPVCLYQAAVGLPIGK